MIGIGGAIAIGVAGVAIAIGVGVGMTNAAESAKEATEYAADKQAEAQKFTAEQQRAAQDHEADLLFKTEQADRELSEKFDKEERRDEQQMMQAFGMIDEIQSDSSMEVERRGSRSSGRTQPGDEYDYPDSASVSDDDMSFS